jgi:hypothetical protein
MLNISVAKSTIAFVKFPWHFSGSWFCSDNNLPQALTENNLADYFSFSWPVARFLHKS